MLVCVSVCLTAACDHDIAESRWLVLKTANSCCDESYYCSLCLLQ